MEQVGWNPTWPTRCGSEGGGNDGGCLEHKHDRAPRVRPAGEINIELDAAAGSRGESHAAGRR